MNELTTINILKVDERIMVSSKEVAERFEKRHDNVLRDIRELQVPDNFRLLNFEEIYDKDTYGRDQQVINMTRDGFTILAFGFTGEKALQWKLSFLDAFNKMEQVILEQLPAIQAENDELRKANFQLTQQIMMLPAPKKPHGNKNTVIVPVQVNTLFGPEIEYKRVPKNSPNFSEITYKEGELRRVNNLMSGYVKKSGTLQNDIANLRRL